MNRRLMFKKWVDVNAKCDQGFNFERRTSNIIIFSLNFTCCKLFLL